MPAPIVYFEFAGPDAAALRTFYSGVFGWNYDDKNQIDPSQTGGIGGGLRQDPPDKVIYMGVPDINATLEQIKAAGGKVIVPRMVVPNVVTFALFTDPAGNLSGLAELGSF